MSSSPVPDYSAVVSATGFLRPRASRSLETFKEHITTSRRILALLGAGLSASSGLPTFRGAGGLWRTHDAVQLSTPTAFKHDAALVWTFYLERIEAARAAEPNRGHYALAELARRVPGFLAISMNIDGLSGRADHPREQIHHLHGSLFTVKCTDCSLKLSAPESEGIIESLCRHAALRLSDIPPCPACQTGLIRPGVVWFTESPEKQELKAIHEWIEAEPTIDTMLVVGTSAEVYPATAYIEGARRKGARVAVVNIEKEDPGLLALEEQDWYFEGDAAKLVPRILDVVNRTERCYDP